MSGEYFGQEIPGAEEVIIKYGVGYDKALSIVQNAKDNARKKHIRYVRARFPVRAITIDEQGNLEVIRTDTVEGGEVERPHGRRKAMTGFSRNARQAMVAKVQSIKTRFNAILTLTYPRTYPSDGKEVKRALNRVLNILRRNDVRYFWWLEFQERGAPHIHILTTAYPSDKLRQSVIKCWVKRFRKDQNIFHKGEYVSEYDLALRFCNHKKFWEECKRIDGGVRYATKYALKMRQKIVPPDYHNVGRFYGCSSDLEYYDTITEIVLTGQELRMLLSAVGLGEVSRMDIIPAHVYNTGLGSLKRSDARSGSALYTPIRFDDRSGKRGVVGRVVRSDSSEFSQQCSIFDIIGSDCAMAENSHGNV